MALIMVVAMTAIVRMGVMVIVSVPVVVMIMTMRVIVVMVIVIVRMGMIVVMMPVLMLMMMDALMRPAAARVLAEHQRLDGHRHGVGRHPDLAEIDVVEVAQHDAVDGENFALDQQLLAQDRAQVCAMSPSSMR